jgi:hypothetical protein
MKTKILIGILVAMLSLPTASHAFGLLRYVYDAVANQLGLDRGPIPKVLPKIASPGCNPAAPPGAQYTGAARIHIQAEGF